MRAALLPLAGPRAGAARRCDCPWSSSFVREGRRYWQCAPAVTRAASPAARSSRPPSCRSVVGSWPCICSPSPRTTSRLWSSAPPRRLLQERLTIKHKLMEVMRCARTRASSTGAWRSTTPTSAANAPAARRTRLAEQGALHRRVQTTPTVALRPASPSSRSPPRGGHLRRQVALALGQRRLRRAVVLPRRHAHRCRHEASSPAAARPAPSAPVQSGQHLAEQPQDRLVRYLPFLHFAKYAHRYLAEVQYRFNRRFDLSAISSPASCAPPPSPPLSQRRSCSLLRFVANQVSMSVLLGGIDVVTTEQTNERPLLTTRVTFATSLSSRCRGQRPSFRLANVLPQAVRPTSRAPP